jgi:hypothetical protein
LLLGKHFQEMPTHFREHRFRSATDVGVDGALGEKMLSEVGDCQPSARCTDIGDQDYAGLWIQSEYRRWSAAGAGLRLTFGDQADTQRRRKMLRDGRAREASHASQFRAGGGLPGGDESRQITAEIQRMIGLPRERGPRQTQVQPREHCQPLFVDARRKPVDIQTVVCRFILVERTSNSMNQGPPCGHDVVFCRIVPLRSRP